MAITLLYSSTYACNLLVTMLLICFGYYICYMVAYICSCYLYSKNSLLVPYIYVLFFISCCCYLPFLPCFKSIFMQNIISFGIYFPQACIHHICLPLDHPTGFSITIWALVEPIFMILPGILLLLSQNGLAPLTHS